MAFSPQQVPHSLYTLAEQARVEEAAILSTCNRTEVYCKTVDESGVVDWLVKQRAVSWQELKPHLYVHKNEHTVKHMLRVASGLDSMIVGEPQILGQLKHAFALAQAAGTIGRSLHPLFQYTFASTKTIRTHTAIGRHPISFAYAIVTLAKRMFTDIRQKNVLLLGAGEMIAMMARYFHEQGAHKMVIANRTQEKAEALARCFNATAIGLAGLEQQLMEADVVIGALATPLPLIGKGLMERTFKKRKRRPQLLIDLGVPRNFEPEIAELEDAYLYCVDDLQQVIAEGLQHRQAAAAQAELLIDTHTHEFLRRMRARQAGKLICGLRKQAETMRDHELVKAQALLERGVASEKVVQGLAKSLTSKLIHRPTKQLYQAAYESQAALLDAAKYYFELTEQE